MTHVGGSYTAHFSRKHVLAYKPLYYSVLYFISNSVTWAYVRLKTKENISRAVETVKVYDLKALLFHKLMSHL